jgi:hypothetical protein
VTQSLIETDSSTDEFDETKEMLWVPLGVAAELPIGNDTHYAVHEAVKAYLYGFETQNFASPDVITDL